jgi:hypothetical protein
MENMTEKFDKSVKSTTILPTKAKKWDTSRYFSFIIQKLPNTIINEQNLLEIMD